MTTTSDSVPYGVRVQLGHAAVQNVVDALGARALHLKGYALDESLVWPGRVGSDVDVLVGPADVARVLAALEGAGWHHYTGFETGSAFGHATTLRHEHFGYADVHRFFPGLGDDPARAFDVLWEGRGVKEIGGFPCPVPAAAGQALVLLLHAGRSTPGARPSADVDWVWERADVARREDIQRLVDELGAHVGFAAASGGLDGFKDRPDYELWRVSSRGGSRLEEWRARLLAARTPRERVRLVLRAPLVNVEHLAAVLGRMPTPTEVAREFVARPVRGLREEWTRRRGKR